MFKVVPLSFVARKAKAKVLSDEWFSWVMVLPMAGKLIRDPGHEIDVDFDLEIEGYWKGKDQRLQVAKLAQIKWRFPSYDIANPTKLEFGDADAPVPTSASGWLVSVPVSLDTAGKPVGRGTFSIKATVTERDRSNAKKYLEAGADFLAEQKPKLVERIGP
jgi:hypothetical protein